MRPHVKPHVKPDGAQIRRRRRRVGLDQETFASRAGIDVKTLRRIEANRTLRPQAATVRAIAGVLGCRPEDLFESASPDPAEGARLGPILARCPECSLPESDPSARFCRRCGLRVREAELGARKPATVLAVCVQTDPAAAALDALHELLRPGALRFEGTLQRTAQGSLAIFGAPIAHEDHAARACRCALWLAAQLAERSEQLGAELGCTLRVGLGIHSGRMLLAGGEAAGGPIPEGALRLAAEAETGRILVSDETHRAVRELFRIEVEPSAGEGAPARRHLQAASLQVETRFDAAASRGLPPRVGRERELAALHGALRELSASGGRVVAVVGDAGVGKSRLCHDFAQEARALGCAVQRVVCPSHARASPLAPVLALARQLLGVGAHAPRSELEAALADALARLGPHDDAGEGAPVLLELLDSGAQAAALPALPAAAQQELVFALLRSWLRVDASAQRAALIVEDVQWMDAASQRFLAGLVAAVRAVGRLVIVSFRRDHLPPWLASPSVDRIVLRPLERSECESLVRKLLGSEVSDPGLAARIAARAGGNPFVAEEIVQELADARKLAGAPGAYRSCGPIGDLGLPPRVEDMVAARIDRLAPARRRILHAAAALEAEVPEQLLAALSGAPSDELSLSLCELQWLDLLFAVHHGVERCFQVKHAIVREVAYRSLLPDLREPDAG